MTIYTQTDVLNQQSINAGLQVAVSQAQIALNTATAAAQAGRAQLQLINNTIAEQNAALALAAAQAGAVNG